MIDYLAATAELRGQLGPERPFLGAANGFRPSTHQRAPRQVKIVQADQRENLRSVFRDPVVAHLRATELALDHAEQMLDPRTDRRHPMLKHLFALVGRRVLLPLSDTPPVGLLFLIIEGQRGEGRMLHAESTFYDFRTVQALNKPELP